MYIYRLSSPLVACHEKEKNDKLDELHLGMAHQDLVLAYICLGAAN